MPATAPAFASRSAFSFMSVTISKTARSGLTRRKQQQLHIRSYLIMRPAVLQLLLATSSCLLSSGSSIPAYGSIPSVTIVMERKTTLKKSLSQLRPVIKVGTLAAKRAIDPQTYLFDSDFSNGPCCRITRRRQTSDLAKGGAVKKLTYVNAKASAMETLLFSKEDEKFMERVEDAMKLARMTGEQCRISDAEVVLDASSYRREKLKCHMKEKNFSTGDLPDIILILKEEL
ncbi:hypothetical protein CSKR_100122 [Clonorchis sinensis]|uniref:Uncharacterized protein n=1 Tax=Clonorchis sinensis TaxID=79923 RepID=A0A3R7D9B6_CLOSI|nr:hypothetical protein CSKR_100122 [Clonorchis sinensis]